MKKEPKNIYKYDIKKISLHYTQMCYYYTFEDFLRTFYNISENTYLKYKRLQEKKEK